MRFSSIVVIAVLCAALPAGAAIWPEQWNTFKRGPVKPAPISDPTLAEEYGLNGSEQAEFSEGAKKFTGTAWRLKDSTSALAYWMTLRPNDAPANDIVDQAVTLPGGGVLMQFGNYVLRFEGFTPTKDQLDTFVNILPKMQDSSIPTIYHNFPHQGLVANSERYILGPVSLERFASKLPLAAVAFSMGAEAEVATVQAKDGPVSLAVFTYPTHHIARARLAEFQQVAGVSAKRAGPLVAVVLQTPSADSAERVLALVNYKATVTLDQDPGRSEQNIGKIVVENLYLAGILILGSIGAGAVFALLRMGARKIGNQNAGGVYTLLDLSKK